MTNPFSDDLMAAGYAAARPPVHPRVVAILRTWLGPARVDHAVDVGCGAGLSTRPLLDLAHHCVGFDPAESMVRAARRVTPGACFVTAGAERMPLRSGSIDLLAAAGSLNYAADLDAVWPEARRVLKRRGCFAVYDFSPGRSLVDDPALDAWFDGFIARHPYPASQARRLSPAILAGSADGFVVTRAETFDIPVRLSQDAYLAYMLTETNVQAAVRAGVTLASMRGWLATSLAPVFDGRDRDVRFTGYLVQLSSAR